MFAYEKDTVRNRGIPCIFFKTLIQLDLLRLFLYYLTYWSKRVPKIIIWRLIEKSASLWGSYILKQGNPLQFFQNTNKKLYVLCIIIITYCILKGNKVKNFWRWIKKVLAFDTDFLVWIMKKTFWKFSFDI